MNDIEVNRIHNRLNVYTVVTDKFKTDLIGIYVKRPLNDDVSLNALLSRILMRGTQQFPSSKDLNIHLEASYGMILVSDVVKYGDDHVLQFKLQFPDSKHISEKDIFNNALKILEEVIFNPYVENGCFSEDYFNQEKENLIDEIESRINDKMSYSLERCIECMYEDEPYSSYVYGDIETVKGISNEALYTHYKKVIEHASYDICVMGDLDKDAVVDSIMTLPISSQDLVDEDVIQVTHKTKNIVVKEAFPVKQGKLVLGYHTDIYQDHKLYEASVLAYHILGGGPTSILFNKLREEEGLCYYVYAKADKFKGCVFIGAGIQSDHYDMVMEMIEETFSSLSVSEDDLDIAKTAMIASIKSISDFPNSFINFYYTELIGKSSAFNMNDMIKAYERVTVEDIHAVYKAMVLDTTYFLEGEHDL